MTTHPNAAMAHVPPLPSAEPNGGAYLQISPAPTRPTNESHTGLRWTALTDGTPGLGSQRRHARRLQLRQAGFPALFPGRADTAARRTSSQHSAPASNAVAPNERPGSPEAGEERRKSTSPPAPNILQEISNHATVRRVSGRSLLSSIFHHSSRNSLEPAEFSIFDDESANASQSIVKSDNICNEMTSESHDGHQRRSSAREMKAGKLQRRRRTSGRSTGSDAAKYIEHLESELVSVNSKLDALTSPSITRSQSAKIRTLNRQAQSLRKEVSDWERKFEDRIEEHVFDRSRVEVSLKAKINELRDEVDTKDLQVHDLQREVDILNEKLAANEALETDMNRRIDVLTQLLAQSPTRSSFPIKSPTVGGESTKRTSRPTSMILPNLKTSSIDFGPNETPTRPSASNRAMESPSLARRRSEQLWNQVSLPNHGPESPELAVLPESQQPQAVEIDHALSDTSRVISDLSPLHSPPSSRPTSLMSTSSIWSAWGLPLQPELPCRTESKSKRMRRFMTGSNALKPLILPASHGVTEPNSPSTNLQEWPGDRDTVHTESDATPTHGKSVEKDNRPISSSNNRTITLRQPQKVPSLFDGATPSLEPGDENFDRGLLAENYALPDNCSPLHSPTLASSPLATRECWVASAVAVDSPNTPKRLSNGVTPESSSTSTNSRIAKIRTPNSNLDALLMDDTPSKLPHGQNLRDELLNMQADLDSTPSTPSQISIYTPRVSNSCVDRVARLIMSLRRETLHSMKAVLVSSWARGTSGFGALGWWIYGLVHTRNALAPRCRSTTTSLKFHARQKSSIDINLPNCGIVAIPEERFLGMPLWPISRSRASASVWQTVPQHPCLDCVEPPIRRNLRLWCKLSLTIVLALGIALIKGPGDLFEESKPLLRSRKSCPQLQS